MSEYDRKIDFKTVWLTIVRRWRIILIFSIPTCLSLVFYTQFIITKTYQSTVTLINKTNLYQNQHNSIELIIKKDETISKTIQNLELRDTPVVIDKSELISGLSFLDYNSLKPGFITFSFDSDNKSIIVPIISELANVALEELKTYGYNDLSILSGPSEPIKSSKENTYFLIGIVSSTFLIYGGAFVTEVVSDVVYDKSDVEIYGCSCFEISASKQRKE